MIRDSVLQYFLPFQQSENLRRSIVVRAKYYYCTNENISPLKFVSKLEY